MLLSVTRRAAWKYGAPRNDHKINKILPKFLVVGFSGGFVFSPKGIELNLLAALCVILTESEFVTVDENTRQLARASPSRLFPSIPHPYHRRRNFPVSSDCGVARTHATPVSSFSLFNKNEIRLNQKRIAQ